MRFPNVYGIDMPTQLELVAYNRTEQEIANFLNVDKLFFQDLSDLKQAISIKIKSLKILKHQFLMAIT